MTLNKLVLIGLVLVIECINENGIDNNKFSCGGEGGSVEPKLFNSDTIVSSPVFIGKVIEDNKIASGVAVTLESNKKTGNYSQNVCTSNNGEFIFSGMDKGTFNLIIDNKEVSNNIEIKSDTIVRKNFNIDAYFLGANIDIRSPQHYQSLDTNILFLTANYEGNLSDLKIYPVLSDIQFGNYFIQYPTAFVDEKTTTIVHENIRPGSIGDWVLYLCVFDDDAHQIAQDLLINNNFSGQVNLPEGASCLDYVIISRTK